MKLGELANFITQLVWTTSDPIAARFYAITDLPTHRNIIMREYICLKMGIAGRILYQASNANNRHEADFIFNAVKDELSQMCIKFSNNDYISYGLKPNEVQLRFNQYSKLVYDNKDLGAFKSLFYNCLDEHYSAQKFRLSGLTLTVTYDNEWLQDLENYMGNKIYDRHTGGNSGCGCFSVVACVSLLIVALLAFMVF